MLKALLIKRNQKVKEVKKMRRLISLSIFVIVLCLVGSAYAVPTLPTYEPAKLKFNNFEKWTDVNGSGWVDAGDIITGIFDVTTISNVTGSNITWQPVPDELTGYFRLTVAYGSMDPALGAQAAFTLGPTDVIASFYDTTRDWDPTAPDAIARATDGDLYFAILGADLIEGLSTDFMPGQTQMNWWADLTANGTGYTFLSQLWPEVLGIGAFPHPVPFPPYFHPGGHTSELYLEGSLYTYGLYGWDFRSEDPAYVWAIPEPGTILLLGAGLIGLGVLRRRMRK